MAFNDVEISEFHEPIELYQFTRGVFSWYMTSADRDIIFQTNTYLAESLTRSSIESTQDLGKAVLKVTMSRRTSFLDQFISSSPTDVISVTITRIHASDADPAVTFKGRVSNVKFAENDAEVTCIPNQSTLKRPGLRRSYQTNCAHTLYGPVCKVIKNSFAIPATIDAASGLTITSTSFIVSINPTFDADWF